MSVEEVQDLLVFHVYSYWHRHISKNNRVFVVGKYFLSVISRIQCAQNLGVFRYHHQY